MTNEELAAIKDIMKYISKNPEAKHTAEGIARYWIFQQRLEEKLEIAKKAIDFLVDEGFLQRIESANAGQQLYKVNKEKLKDIPQELENLK